jgi:hypothetical protein
MRTARDCATGIGPSAGRRAKIVELFGSAELFGAYSAIFLRAAKKLRGNRSEFPPKPGIRGLRRAIPRCRIPAGRNGTVTGPQPPHNGRQSRLLVGQSRRVGRDLAQNAVDLAPDLVRRHP